MDGEGRFPHLTELFDFSRPRGFIFDLDGTLLDSAPWHAKAFRETLAEHASDYLDSFDETIIKGRGSTEVFVSLGIEPEDRITFLTEDKRRRYQRFIHDGKVRPVPGAVDLIRLLRSSGRILIVVTSASEATASASLKAAGLINLINHIVTAEQAVVSKPSSDPFQRALRLAQLKPWQTVTIEDADIGIEASRAAEIEAILVNQVKPIQGIPTFRTLEDLYRRVRRDLKVEDAVSTESGLEITHPPLHHDWDERLGERPPNYDPTSDRELLKLFGVASERGKSVRLLRIGAPLLFRRQITGLLDETSTREGVAIDAFLDYRIPFIRVLLADPDDMAFLGRLDYERAGSWGIWRVRHEVLHFAKGLAMLATHRRDRELEVGFHRGELIWNVGIVGETTVLVRAYGRGSGHDTSVRSQWLSAGEDTYIAESFVNLWEATSKRSGTRWLTPDMIDFNTAPKWPSLYKGNAVLARERDFDKEDFSTNVPKHVQKIDRNLGDHEAERKWLLLDEEQRAVLRHFRPVRLARIGAGRVPRPLGRTPLVMERIRGVSLFEIASLLNEAGEVPDQRDAAANLLGELLHDSVQALVEFRRIADIAVPAKRMRRYPYAERLMSALTEVRSFIGAVSTATFDQAVEEARVLGEELEANASVPFRDAHLKNRLWSTNEEAPDLVERLLTLDSRSVRAEMGKAVKDIDFETSGYVVTEWDDVIHLLFFEKSGAGPLCAGLDGKQCYERWWGPVGGETHLWRTVLARSIRELCRRLWYARAMPNTYLMRYQLESRDFFLDLALHATTRLSIYQHLERLLKGIKDSPEIWSRVPEEPSRPTLVARGPTDQKPQAEGQDLEAEGIHDIFIAHNSKDKASVLALVRALEQRGIRTWLDVREIPPGRWFQDVLQAAVARSRAAAIVLGPHGLGKWEALELRTFVSQCVKREIPVIPVLLPGMDQVPPELLFLQELNYVKFDETPDDLEGINNLVWGITGRKPAPSS
jgi:HAD superfamily hydrolase (TIGR01509 family)